MPFVLILLSGEILLRWMEVDAAIIPTAVEYMDALAWGAPGICMVLFLRFFSEGSGNTRPGQ